MSIRAHVARAGLAALVLVGCGGSNEPGETADEGTLVLWASDPGRGQLTVVANDVSRGTLLSPPSSGGTAPSSCEASLPSYAIRLTLEPSFYRVKVTAENGEYWDFETAVVEGQCNIRELSDPEPPPEATGQIVFWTSLSDEVPIQVEVAGEGSGLIMTARTSQPPCGATGSLTLTVPAGTHAFEATGDQGTFWEGPFSVEPDGCLAMELILDEEPTGTLTVWTRLPVSGDPIALRANGAAIGAITQSRTSAPACGAAGTVSVPLPAGDYRIQGNQTGAALTWDFMTEIVEGDCTLWELTGPEVSTGKLQIWSAFSLAGAINISLNGTFAGQVTNYHTALLNTCNTPGALTVTLPAGSYAVTGQSANGFTWSGGTPIMVSAGGCSIYRMLGPGGTAGAPSRWGVYGALTANGNGIISVAIDGVNAGTINLFYNTPPSCDAAGVVSAWLDPGTHNLFAQAQSGTVWQGPRTLTPGSPCTTAALL